MSIVTRFASALLVVVAVMTGCGEVAPPAGAAEGPQQQIILKWREATSQQQRAESLQAATARSRVSLQYLRDTAVGGSVYKTTRMLSREEMGELLRTLTADPHVEYVEEDSMLRPMPRG